MDSDIEQLFCIVKKVDCANFVGRYSQIINVDASQIFNITNNQLVQGFGSKVENHNHSDKYREKYIKMLEAENERLKKMLS